LQYRRVSIGQGNLFKVMPGWHPLIEKEFDKVGMMHAYGCYQQQYPMEKVEMLPGRPVLEMGEGAHTGTEKGQSDSGADELSLWWFGITHMALPECGVWADGHHKPASSPVQHVKV
jgi:hypothetical protein